MKHLKHHPLNDKQQQLSKDMKNQELVKPKKDKKLDADDSLSNPKLSKRYVKPSNKKLSSEEFLSGGKAKKVNESFLQPLSVYKEKLENSGENSINLLYEWVQNNNISVEEFKELIDYIFR